MPWAEILSLQLHVRKGEPLVQVASAEALLDAGLAGDTHGKKKPGSSRQVLFVEQSALQAFGLEHGQLREQVTVGSGLDLDRIPAGAVLSAGGARFLVSGPCDPCLRIGEMLGYEDREAFRKALEGRRGILTKVIAPGMLRIGEALSLES